MGEERDVEARLDAVLADARDALEESTEDGEVTATPTLRAVASAASSLVEDADSETLLNAVDLGGEDGYDTIVAALSKGDEENVRELRQLLRLSKLADSWDDPEADEHRQELATLFEVGPTTADGDDATDTDAADGDETSDAAEADAEDDGDDGSSVAEDIVDTVVERFTDEGEDDATGDASDAVSNAADAASEAVSSVTDDEAESGEATEDEGVASLRSRVEDAADRLRGQVGDEGDEEEATEEAAEDTDGAATGDSSREGGGRERLSTIPKHGRNPTRFSTMPEGGSATRFSTMPKR